MSEDSQIAELLKQGIQAVKAGRTEEARQILMEVVERDERNEQGWLWLSGVVETLHDRRICLENALAINPDNAHARSGLQWLDQHQPQPADAQERCPGCGAALPASGSACPECGLPLIVSCPGCAEYIEIEKSTCPACGYALGDFRQGATYHLEMAQAHLARGRMDRAQEALALAEAGAGDDPEVWARLASAYTNLGRADQAVAAYELAIKGDPDRASLYAGLAGLYRQRGQTEKAQEMYDKAGELAAGNSSVLCALARTYLAQGARTEALQCLEKVLKSNPKNAEAHLILGDAYRAQGRVDRARRLYQTTSELAPRDSALSQEAQSKLAQIGAVSGPDPTDHMVTAGAYRRARPQGRPGCLSIYVFLTGMGGLFGLLGAVMIATLLTSGRKYIEEAFAMAGQVMPIDMNIVSGALWLYVAIAAVMASINLAMAFGLWYLKNWARILAIVVNSLTLILNLIQSAVQLLSMREITAAYGGGVMSMLFVAPLLIGLVIQGIIIFWFAINRDLFS